MLRLVTIKREDEPAHQLFNEEIDYLLTKYKYVEDLWEEIGTDFPTGIAKLVNATGVPKAVLIEILADASKEIEPEQRWWLRLTAWVARRKVASVVAGWWNKPRPWARQWYRTPFARHWPEFVGLAIILTLLLLLITGALRGRNTVLIVPETGLPAFHVISKDDIKVLPMIYVPGSLSSNEEAIGHYLLQQVPGGSRLYGNQLSKMKLSDEDASGRQVLSLPLKASFVSTKLSPLDRVSLLFSPREIDQKSAVGDKEEGALRVDDVIVLAVNRQGDAASVVVAMRADMQKVAASLGNSDIIIFQPMAR
jgi:hypothetical protein